MHSPCEDSQNRQPDFIVEYEIDLCDEMKNAKPHQGMRTDFLYHGDNPQVDGIHMIWPEFLDENGLPIEDKTLGSTPLIGKANMWIVSEEMRDYHRNRLKIGTKGYWVRGPYRVAKVTVIELGEMSC